PLTTRRPTSPLSTPGPTAATTPPTPLPGIIGSSTGNGPVPARTWVSTKVMLANTTSINACPGPGTGAGVSAGTATSGPPNSLSHPARIGTSFRSAHVFAPDPPAPAGQ